MDLRMIGERGVRLLAFDLDGTLLRDDKTISPRTRAAVEKAIDKGIAVMAATGRPLNAIPDVFLEISGIRYLMSANGANIYDRERDSIIYRANISPEMVEYSVDFLDPYDIWYEVLIDGISYVDRCKFDHMEDYVLPSSFEYLRRTRVPVDDLRATYRAHPDRLEKVCCFFKTPALREEVARAFPMTEEMMALEATEVNFEITDRTSTKGCALAHMGELLQIPIEQIAAFGDGMNDAPMIEAAGIGVAMANAFPALQEIADYVTVSNEEDGVAVVIEAILDGMRK